jgi:DNA polymerase
MGKAEELGRIAADLNADESLPLREANVVFGEGNPDAEVVFIGEAPGKNEDLERRPFVGRAGQLLRALIREAGWEERDVYITNIVKRRPPENRDPLPHEIESYKPYLARQLRVLKPKVIATLGRFSMNYFLPLAKISRDHGKVYKLGNSLLVPLYHPAAALRATGVKQELERDFKKLPRVVQKYSELLSKYGAPDEGKEGPRETQEGLL